MTLSGYSYIFFGILFLLIIGFLILQYFLSKNENKWLGLILPLITFIFALISVFGYSNYENTKGVELFFSLLAVFFLQNVPTLILMAIYLGTRSNKKKTTQLNKMKIKDL